MKSGTKLGRFCFRCGLLPPVETLVRNSKEEGESSTSTANLNVNIQKAAA